MYGVTMMEQKYDSSKSYHGNMYILCVLCWPHTNRQMDKTDQQTPAITISPMLSVGDKNKINLKPPYLYYHPLPKSVHVEN